MRNNANSIKQHQHYIILNGTYISHIVLTEYYTSTYLFSNVVRKITTMEKNYVCLYVIHKEIADIVKFFSFKGLRSKA